MDGASGSAVVLRTPQKVAPKDSKSNPSFIPRSSTSGKKKRPENCQGRIPDNVASNENTPHHSNMSMVTPLPPNRSMMTPQHSKKSTLTEKEFWRGNTPCSLDKPLPEKVRKGFKTPAPNLMSTINEAPHGLSIHKSTKRQGQSFLRKPKTATSNFSKEPIRAKHSQSARRFTSPKEGPSGLQTPATTRPGQKYVSSTPRQVSQPAPPSTPIQKWTPESNTNRREALMEWKLRQASQQQFKNVDVYQNNLREKLGGSAQKLRDKQVIKSLKSNDRIAPSLKLQLEKKLELEDEKANQDEVRACMDYILNSINVGSISNASLKSPNVGEELFIKAELTRKRQKEREESFSRQAAQENAMLEACQAQKSADQLANDEKLQKARESMLAALGTNSGTSKVPAKTPARKLDGRNIAEETPRSIIRNLSKLPPQAPLTQPHQTKPSDLEATKSKSTAVNDSSALLRDPQPTSKSKANGAKGLKTPTTSGRLRRLSKGVTTPPPFSLNSSEPCPPLSKSAQRPRGERRMSHPRYVEFEETLKKLDVNAATPVTPVTPLSTSPQRSWWRSSWLWTARILATLSFWIILKGWLSKQKPGSCRDGTSSSIFLSECVPDQDTNYIKAGEALDEDPSTIKGGHTKVETTPDSTTSKDEALTNQEKTAYGEGPVIGEDAVEWERTAPAEVEQIEVERLTQEEAAEKLKLEQKHLEQERLELEKAEFERAERLEQERLEQERLERERLEQERLEQERLEQEQLAFEKAEFERAEKEQERLGQERFEQECQEQERAALQNSETERAGRERGTVKHTNMPKRAQSKKQESISGSGNDAATDTVGKVTDYGSSASTLRWLAWFAFVRAKIHLVAASVVTGYFLMRPTRTPATGAVQTEELSRTLSEKVSKLQLSITTTFCDLAERVLGISEDVKESSGEEYSEECYIESSSELDEDVLSDADDPKLATDYDEMDPGDYSGSQSESGELIDEENVQQETQSPVLAPRTISNSMRSTVQTSPDPVVNEETFTSRSPVGDAGLYNAVEYVQVRGTPFVEKRSVRRSLRNR